MLEQNPVADVGVCLLQIPPEHCDANVHDAPFARRLVMQTLFVQVCCAVQAVPNCAYQLADIHVHGEVPEQTPGVAHVFCVDEQYDIAPFALQ